MFLRPREKELVRINITVLQVVVLNKNDLDSKTAFLEDANHLSMPTIRNFKIMKVLFHFSLKHCLYDEGRRNGNNRVFST